jgi:hypothetical protein
VQDNLEALQQLPENLLVPTNRENTDGGNPIMPIGPTEDRTKRIALKGWHPEDRTTRRVERKNRVEKTE